MTNAHSKQSEEATKRTTNLIVCISASYLRLKTGPWRKSEVKSLIFTEVGSTIHQPADPGRQLNRNLRFFLQNNGFQVSTELQILFICVLDPQKLIKLILNHLN